MVHMENHNLGALKLIDDKQTHLLTIQNRRLMRQNLDLIDWNDELRLNLKL